MLDEIFLPYNYIGEIASFLIAVLALLAIVYVKPRMTYSFRYVCAGLGWSALSSAILITILVIANNPNEFYNRYLFLALILAYLICYNAVLFLVFAYVNMMSIRRQGQKKEFMMMYVILSSIYAVGVIIEIASGRIYTMDIGGIDLSVFVRFYSVAGIVCAILCYCASVTNRKDIARIVWTTVCICVPLDALTLSAQYFLIHYNHIVFTGITHSVIFVFAFLLFHAEPYNEISGCQGVNALNRFIDKKGGKKEYYLIYVFFTIPARQDLSSFGLELALSGIKACRTIEALTSKLTMYQVADDRYVDVIENVTDKEARNYINQIRGTFDWLKSENKMPFNYCMIAGKVGKELNEADKVRQFYEFIANRFTDQNSTHFYMITDEDHEKFEEYYITSEVLRDIRNTADLDDDRVIVYAQPIYSVETESFRVAEALMRIKIGDRVVSPDRFIPVAENTGCIHTLSCIIVNKVCKAIEQLSDTYDFDAISVNISSKELSNANMYQDFLDIIEKYDIDVSKIRMEITETAMFENEDLATRNMQILDKEGIQLYLDDFGTGYSSLERVMNCPVKTIKFDKTLLYKSLDDNRMDDILTYMIEVLKKNGFVTLVEGVEDESQCKFSMDRGFDYIQGYHYAKPAPIEELKNFFSRKSAF